MPVGQPLLMMPRGPGEVLDQAGLRVRSLFPQALRAVLIGYLPWSILLGLQLVPGAARFAEGRMPPAEVVQRHLIWLSVWIIGDALLLRQFCRGWLFSLLEADLQGRTINNRAAAITGLRRLPAAAMATALTYGVFGGYLWLVTAMASQGDQAVLGAMIATPLVVLIGFPVAIFGYLAVAITVLERRQPFSAVARSFRWVAGGFWGVLVIAVVLTVIRFFTGLLPAMMPNLWLQSIVNTSLLALLVIFEVAVESVLHFQLRCQNDWYDLELMSREVELMAAEEVEALPNWIGSTQRDPLA